MEFPDEDFDAVLTIFVSQFLDPARVFPEFYRVLKDGGYFGVNEMYKADDVPVDALDHVARARIRSPASWGSAFGSAGFSDIFLEQYSNYSQQPYALNNVDEFGGWGKLIGTLWRILVLALKSGKMRERFGRISKAKSVLLRDRVANRYLGYILCVGKKSLTV